MKRKTLFVLPVALVVILLGVSLCLVDQAGAGVLVPPQKVAVFPPPESHTADVTTPISITYDQDMDPLTVNPQTFAVHARQTGWLMDTLSVSGGTIRLDPLSQLHAGELVQVSATTQTLSLGGEGPLNPTVWQFTAAPWSGNAYFHLVQSWGDVDNRDNALGDLDGDGDLDMVTSMCGQEINVLHNDGSANFTQVQQITLPQADCISDVELGDLDGDGDLDAFLVDYNTNYPDRVLFNNGDGTFTLGIQTVPAYEDTYAELGDLDGDGDLDIFVVSGGFGTSTIRTWMNDGEGNFTLGSDFDSSYEHTGVALGDLDMDGDLDAFTAGWFNSYNKIWLNDGTGTFTQGQVIPNANTYMPLLGDLDSDGDLDVYLANVSYGIGFFIDMPDQVWLNDGTGNFTDSGQIQDEIFCLMPALGDLDADGDLDVYLTNWDWAPDEVWLNDGAGNFSWGYRTNENEDGIFVTLGDLDGDGDLDTVIGDGVENHDVFLNGGWLLAEPLPHPLALSAHVQCVDDPNSLYVIGGADGYGSPTNFAYRYDVSNNNWTQLSNLPSLAYGLSGVCVDGKIYIVDWSNSLKIYDIDTDTWISEVGVPRLTEGSALGTWDGKLYMVGGVAGFNYQATDEVDVYDIATHTWTPSGGMSMPQGVDYAGVVQTGPYLYIVGGGSYIYQEVYLVQRYDMATDSWQTADYPSGLDFTALTATGEFLYAMGGDPPGDELWTSTDLVQRLGLDEWLSGEWEDIHVPLPKISFGASSFCTDVLSGGEIWHIGGGDGATGEVYSDTFYLPAEPCVSYGVELLAPQGGWGTIGGVVEYELGITNTGTITDYYEVIVETTWPANNLLGGRQITGGPGPVGPGESIQMYIAVDIPEDVQPGDEGVSEITAVSMSDPSAVDTATITTTAYICGVVVDPESEEKLGEAGETLEYKLTVTNTGSVGDVFDIALSGNTWTTTVPTTTGWLEPGEAVEVLVSVNIPPDAPPEAEDVAVLTFTSQGDPEVSASSTLTSRRYGYGVAVAPESAEMWGMPGDTLTYTLVVTNTGEAGDMYSIVISGNLWTTEAPTMTVWLEVGVTDTVQVVVSIPPEAMAGEWDIAVLTITSQHDPEQFAVVTLTSRVPVWFTYLPMITK